MKGQIKLKKAVALKYDINKDSAPKITALGKGITAENILKKAQENEVNIYHDEKLVNELIQFQVGTEIPPQLYEIVAQVLIFVESINEKKGLLKK